MNPRPPNDLVGRLVAGGRYRVEATLDAGGMGAVYTAVRVADGLQVAIKVLHPALARETRHVERFQRECRVTAMLEHPHIVRVLEATDGSTGEPPFLVMEYLEGTSLQRRLRTSKTVPAREAVLIARQVLAALSAAHGIGILHRDLKPSNVLLVPGVDGKPHAKVIDFGVAGLMETEGYQKLTRTGHVVGTPAYMPPEQALGLAVDERADVYAAGAILFAALSGKHPYQGRVDQILPKLIRGERPKLGDLTRGLDPRLVDMVETAMSTSAEQRFRSAAAFDQALGLLDDEPVTTVDSWRSPLPLETLRFELSRGLASATMATTAPPTAIGVPAPTRDRKHRGPIAAIAGLLGVALVLGLTAIGAGAYLFSPRDSGAPISPAGSAPSIQPVAPVTPSTGGAASLAPVDEAPRTRRPQEPHELEESGAAAEPEAQAIPSGAPPSHPPQPGPPGGSSGSRAPKPPTTPGTAASPRAPAGSGSTGPPDPAGRRRFLEVNVVIQGVTAPQPTAVLRARLGDLISCVDRRGGPPYFTGSVTGTVDDNGVMAAPSVNGSHPAAAHCLRQRLPERWPPAVRGQLTMCFVHTNVE